MYRFVFFFVFSFVQAQIELPGACNFTSLEYVKTIDPTFLGDWNQVARISNTFEQGVCSRSSYSARSTTDLEVVNSEVVNKTLRFRNGTISVRTNGVLNISFSDGSYDYVVLKTDNTNYAVLYSCKDGVNDTRSVWAWQLSRRTSLTTQQIKDVDAVVSTNVDLKNATWMQVGHPKDICSSAATLLTTPFLMFFAVYVVCKAFLS